MKSTIIIAAALTLTVNILFASNDNTGATVTKESNTVTAVTLAPELPSDADFEDAIIVDFTVLAPVSPAEAQFEEMTVETAAALNLAPLAPAVAEFEEAADFGSLVPLTPAEADFE